MNSDVQTIVNAADTGVDENTRTVPPLADALDEIEGLIRRYIALSRPELAMLISVWITSTYTYEKFTYCGYLAVRSATPRCGKTRLLRLVALLANGNPPITATPTAAALFRTLRKVLILDEVDRLRNADRESYGDVLAVLNTGFEAGGVVERVERTKGSGFEVKEYPTYGPKALAGIESLADTLTDRSFQIQMERTPARMPRLAVHRLADDAKRLRLGLMAWADLHSDELSTAYDSLPNELPALAGHDDRYQDIAEPLIVLASLADAERPDGPAVLPRLLEGLAVAAGRREPSGRERELLAFLEIAEARLGLASEVFVKTADLLADCQGREELSRIETGRALAAFLRHFDLLPKSTGSERGYSLTREWVENWRARYGTRQEAA